MWRIILRRRIPRGHASGRTRSDSLSAHDRYLRLVRLVRERDDGIAAAFDDLRRSTAIQRLAGMINLEVIK